MAKAGRENQVTLCVARRELYSATTPVSIAKGKYAIWPAITGRPGVSIVFCLAGGRVTAVGYRYEIVGGK